jgi:hypothetical protein
MSSSSALLAIPMDRMQWWSRPGLRRQRDAIVASQKTYPSLAWMICRLSTESRGSVDKTHLKASAKPCSATDDPVFDADLDILVFDLAVSLRCIVVSEDLERPDHIDSLRTGLDEHERVTLVRRRVGRVCNGQDDVDSVSRITGARNPL